MAQALGGRDLKLTGLIPWLTRDNPLVKPIQTPELRDIYLAAQDNLWRADAIVKTVALIIYAVRYNGTVPASEMDFYQGALSQWEELLPMMPDGERGIDGIFTNFLVQGWTTFETLVADTWEAAVKRHHGTGLPRRLRSDNLHQVRKAYATAFNNEPAIMVPLNDSKLDALNAVRQVLVHKCGKADDKYVERLQDMQGNTLAPNVPKGTLLPIDGELTAKLLLAGRPLAVDVLKAVDDWLVANPVR